MKNAALIFATSSLLIAGTVIAKAQSTQTQVQKLKSMETGNQSKEVVQGFFNAFGKGDFQGIINSFHDSCSITAVREAEKNTGEVYGSYRGKEGVREFLSRLGSNFDTKSFSVSHIIGEGNVVFANGRFTHLLKLTGKAFTSDWALMCIVKEGRILEYHFYEDSEKFAEASRY